MHTSESLELDIVDTTGRAVRLADFRGSASVLLYFMRATTCPQCNAVVQRLAERATQWRDEGVEVLIAVPEDIRTAAEWKDKRSVPFPVVVGRSGTAHADAGLLRKVFGAIQQSGTVLLDREGTVRYRHIATNPGASYRPAELDAAIRGLSVPREA